MLLPLGVYINLIYSVFPIRKSYNVREFNKNIIVSFKERKKEKKRKYDLYLETL